MFGSSAGGNKAHGLGLRDKNIGLIARSLDYIFTKLAVADSEAEEHDGGAAVSPTNSKGKGKEKNFRIR